MLSHDKLFKKDYNKIFEYSKYITEKVYSKWSDKELHDPGVTLLEMFSFLKDLQQYYMEQTTDKTQKNLLKILGIDIKRGIPLKIEALVDNISNKTRIANREKIVINNQVYESVEAKVLLEEDVSKIATTCNEKETNIYEMPLKYENYFYPFGNTCDKNNSFSIGFAEKFDDFNRISLYVKIGNHFDIERTKIKDYEKHYPIALIKWQYLGIDKGQKKWINMNIFKDETYNLIQSGKITFNVPYGEAIKETYYDGNHEPCYWIRGILEDGYYDLPPRIEYITLNSIELIQKDTIVNFKNITLDALNKYQEIVLQDFMDIYGDIIVFVKYKNGWLKLKDSEYDYRADNNMDVKIQLSSERIGSLKMYEGNEEVIKIVSFEKGKKEMLCLGSGTGFSNQRINLPYDDIVYDDVNILIAETDSDGEIVYRQWEKTESIKSCSKYDRAYEIDVDTREITFGDGINGRVIPRLDNNVFLIGLSRSGFNEAGINKKHKLEKNFYDKNKITLETKYIDIVEKAENVESIEKAMERCEGDFLKPSRTITEEDYLYFVRKVPGLIIKDISLFPGYTIETKNNTLIPAHNSITIQVEPYEGCNKKCTHYYRENIIRYLEDYRLLTTEVNVCFPEYIGIDIYLDIKLKQNNIYLNEEIRKGIQVVFRDCESSGEITVDNIYMAMMKLEEIKNINSIQLMISYGAGYRNKEGNIVIPKNGRPVINDVDVVFTKI